jgi:hypothetical protein
MFEFLLQDVKFNISGYEKNKLADRFTPDNFSNDCG